MWKVQRKSTGQHFALKEMSKARIIAKRSEKSVMNEKLFLSRLRHTYLFYVTRSFIVNIVYAFQDRESMFLVMDLLSGGDLRYHLSRRKTFTEEETSKHGLQMRIEFMIACMVVGLEFIHSSGILHRDIKPENLLFDSDGIAGFCSQL